MGKQLPGQECATVPARVMLFQVPLPHMSVDVDLFTYGIGTTQMYLRLIALCYPELICMQCDYLGVSKSTKKNLFS